MKTLISLKRKSAPGKRPKPCPLTIIRGAIVACAGSMTCAAAESVSFTRITEGVIATDKQLSIGVAWGDYDADGNLDVYFTSTGDTQGALYRNLGTGAFERSKRTPIATDTHHGAGCVWADFENDGDLDLFVADWQVPSRLYLNNGGIFTASLYESSTKSMGVTWGDYNEDGLLDLFFSNGGPERFTTRVPNMLYQNNGIGRFIRVPAAIAGPVVKTSESSIAAAWSDLNDDGFPDLFVTNFGQANSLFFSTPDHQFVPVLKGSLVEDVANSYSSALADYDNDGDIDIFVANGSSYPKRDQGQRNVLYRNEGSGEFTDIVDEPLGTDIGRSFGAAWADYDNDGWLDLFVSNGDGLNQENFLYRNNGDGTFTRTLEGGPATDRGNSFGCAWSDYDNDGFLDLMVANGGLSSVPEVNFLYHNGGNENRWIRIKCVGTSSNRSGIGAKVRVRATIGGKTFWQVREINSGSGFCGNAIDAHFGLGDAETVDVLRVEWPSGIVQEWSAVEAGQILEVIEAPTITLSSVEHTYDGKPKEVITETKPPGLNVRVTYDGQERPPINAGNYAVVVTIENETMTGSAEGILTIRPASQTIHVEAPRSLIFDGTSTAVSTMNNSGLPVSLSLVSGPARLEENAALTPTGVGTVQLLASQEGNENFEEAEPVTIAIEITAPHEQQVSGDEGALISIPLLAHGVSSLEYRTTETPDHGSLEKMENEWFYQSHPGFGGNDVFRYSVVDTETATETEVSVQMRVERTTGTVIVRINVPGGGWKLAGETVFHFEQESTVFMVPGEYQVMFKELSGELTPASVTLVLNAGDEKTIDGAYRRQNPYQVWLSEVFTPEQLADPAVSAAGADIDRDGYTTVAEWALRLNPIVAEKRDISNGTNEGPEPHVRLVNDANGRHLRMTFLRRSDHQVLNIGYHVEFSNQLLHWKETPVVSLTPVDDHWEQVTAQTPAATGLIGHGETLYARLRVTYSEPD